MMEDDLGWKKTYDGRQLRMKEDDLKTKRTCTGGRHTALDIFRFAVFFVYVFPLSGTTETTSGGYFFIFTIFGILGHPRL